MAEILTESFCERCGARYTFETTAPRRRGLGRIGTLSRGVKNFVANDDASFTEAMAAAREDDARKASLQQLDAFHKAFTFCMSCRQYTCRNCWNTAVGECLSCAPNLSLEALPPAFPNANLAGPAPLPTAPSTQAGPNVAASAWPVSDRRVAPAPHAAVSGPPTAEISIEPPVAISGLLPAEIPGPPTAEISIEPPVAISGLLPAEIPGPPTAEISGLPPAAIPGPPTAAMDSMEISAIDAELTPAELTAIQEVLAYQAARPARGALPGPAPSEQPVGPAATAIPPAPADAAPADASPADAAEVDAVKVESIPDVPIPSGVPDVVARPRAETRRFLGRFRPRPRHDVPVQAAPASGDASDAAVAPHPALPAAGEAARLAATDAPPAMALEPAATAASPAEPLGRALEPTQEEAASPEPVAEALAPVAAELEPEPVAAEPEPEPVAAEAPEPVAEAPEPVAAEPEPEPVAAEPEPVPVAAEPVPVPIAAEAPEPVAAEPEPVPIAAEAPEPVAAEPEPVPIAAEAPEPVAAEPEPVAAEAPAPEALVAEPAPVSAPGVVPVAAESEPAPLAAEPAPEPVAAEPTPPRIDVVVQPEWRMVAPDGSVEEQQPSPAPWATPGPVPRRPEDMPSASWAARVATARPVESPIWAASSRNVLAPTPPGAAGTIGVQSCVSCGLSLSASARFCRRCGTRQG